MNRAILMGRLVADPELRTTQSGISTTTFTIAVDRSYTGKDQERQTDFLPIVAWRNTAEFICKYFKKGSMILVEGSIRVRNYEAKDGSGKRYVTEIFADNVHFTGSRNESQSNRNPYDEGGYSPMPSEYQAAPKKQPAQASSYSSGSNEDFQMIPSDEDDLPF